jgi:hypothetical protein
MNFSEFLVKAKQKNFWKKSPVICFYGEELPILFFRKLTDFAKEKNIINIESLRVKNKKELWEILKQSFLGETSFYWLGDVEAIKKGKGTALRGNEPCLAEILSLYKGPHSIAFFLSRDQKISLSIKKRMIVVDIGNNFSFMETKKIFSFFKQNLDQDKTILLREIFSSIDRISLDHICMLINYFSVTGRQSIDRLKQKIAAIIDSPLSLSSLAKTFFRQEKEKFFSLWSECNDQYSVPFWTAYWSEQIWRAHFAVKFLKQNNFPAAKRISFRLPPSFIKYDWRKCSINQLKGAYDMLYDIDFAFKRGSTFCSLDLFYSKYFLDQF